MAVALPTAAALLPIGSDPPVALPTAVADPPVASSAIALHVQCARKAESPTHTPVPQYRTRIKSPIVGIES